jgi:hypothetical protein
MFHASLAQGSAYAEAHLTYQAPVIRYGTKRWVAYDRGLAFAPIEVDAPTQPLARLQASYKLGLSVKCVHAHEVTDPKRSRMNRRA